MAGGYFAETEDERRFFLPRNKHALEYYIQREERS
jgi:hypothetical protein